MARRRRSNNVIYTVGHSTRSDEEMLELLRAHGVTMLADVRTIPRSRTNPQFNTDVFGKFLRKHKIRYEHIPELGGLRHARADSPNTVWENKSFRGYADYMETDQFDQVLNALIEESHHDTIAVMCSEAVWWRCHRSMIADALVAKGIPVHNIMSETSAPPHKLRSFAHVEGNHVSYRQ